MIDLHSHSIYSDGTNTPAELVAMAVKRGLTALALTDHDTVGGIVPLLEAAKETAVEPVPGIELSAECSRGTMHILGYFIDHTCPVLLEKIEQVQKGRHERNLEILKKLNKLGYVLTWEDVTAQAGTDVVGRPHFAQALIKRGHLKTFKSAFDLLLAKGRPAYAERYHYSGSECVDLIRQAGGVSVLAHPATIHLPDDQFKGVLMGLKESGLSGIEVFCSSYQAKHVKKYSELAAQLDLIRSGGTDFHGKNTPDLQLGIGFGKLRIADEILEQLRDARG
ncbi:MAG: PHP domain-containing protein [Pontiella sp.]